MPQAATSVKLDDTTDILKRLSVGLEETGSAELNARFERIDQQIKSAEKIVDAQKRDAALSVIKADLDTLLKDSNQEEADFATAVNSLDQLAEQIGGDFEKLQQLSVEEKQLVTDAEEKLKAAEAAWFGREAKVKLATDLLAEAKIEAAKRMRKRLMNAKFEESIAVFQRRSNEAIRILGIRRDSVIVQLKNVSARKAAAYQVLHDAAETIQKLEAQSHEVDQQLANAESELKGISNGTTEYAAQQKIVSDFKEKSTAINGQLNAAVTIHQSKERFALQLEVHEIAQTKLQNNITMWIAGLKSDMEERVVTIQSRLDAAKSMSTRNSPATSTRWAPSSTKRRLNIWRRSARSPTTLCSGGSNRSPSACASWTRSARAKPKPIAQHSTVKAKCGKSSSTSMASTRSRARSCKATTLSPPNLRRNTRSTSQDRGGAHPRPSPYLFRLNICSNHYCPSTQTEMKGTYYGSIDNKARTELRLRGFAG